MINHVRGDRLRSLDCDISRRRSPSLPGDFNLNLNGVVDAADYTVWRDTLGTTTAAPFTGADANGDSYVSQADYDVWRNNFGTVAPGAAHAVPEPAAFILVGWLALLCLFARRELRSATGIAAPQAAVVCSCQGDRAFVKSRNHCTATG